MIILPGTKNTMDDLLWLRQSGLEAEILKYASSGGLILGYNMRKLYLRLEAHL